MLELHDLQTVVGRDVLWRHTCPARFDEACDHDVISIRELAHDVERPGTSHPAEVTGHHVRGRPEDVTAEMLAIVSRDNQHISKDVQHGQSL